MWTRQNVSEKIEFPIISLIIFLFFSHISLKSNVIVTNLGRQTKQGKYVLSEMVFIYRWNIFPHSLSNINITFGFCKKCNWRKKVSSLLCCISNLLYFKICRNSFDVCVDVRLLLLVLKSFKSRGQVKDLNHFSTCWCYTIFHICCPS